LPYKEYSGERSLVTEPIIGYRVWEWHQGMPHSLNGVPWHNAKLTAECNAYRHPKQYTKQYDFFAQEGLLDGIIDSLDYEDAPIPTPDCSCGIYARYFPQDIVDLFRRVPVIGVIAATGNIELGSRGFRAEKAKIIALVHEFLNDSQKTELKKYADDNSIAYFDNMYQLVDKYPQPDLSNLLFDKQEFNQETYYAYQHYMNFFAAAINIYQPGDVNSNTYSDDYFNYNYLKRHVMCDFLMQPITNVPTTTITKLIGA
jgi:hypothetical protein